MTRMSANQLDTVASKILEGLLVHMPDVPPDKLELILARVARMHRERVEQSEAAGVAAIEEAARAEAVERMQRAEALMLARQAEAKQRDEVIEKQRQGVAAARLARAIKDGAGSPLKRKKKFPVLVGQIRALRRDNPTIKQSAALRHFETMYGPKYLSGPGFRVYWLEATGPR